MSAIANPKGIISFQGETYPVPLAVTDSGTVAAGFKACSFINTDNSVAVTVGGISIPAGLSMTYPFVGTQYHSPITYDASGSSMLILAIY